MCRLDIQGDLGLRSICTLNKSSSMKFYWDILNSYEPWAMLLKVRTLKKGRSSSYHTSSSIWMSIKKDFGVVNQCSRSIIGDGLGKNFWFDAWIRPPLILSIQTHDVLDTNIIMSNFLHNGSWNFPNYINTIASKPSCTC